MADPVLNRCICEVCGSEFLHPTSRKTCSDACRERSFEDRRAETRAERRARSKECPECRRVFTWEEVGGAEFQFDARTCCSAACHLAHQKKETAVRNSIDYHGVKLSIEDVCRLEQRDGVTIRRLLNSGSIPGARWAEPELRAARRTRQPGVPKDELIKVHMTRELKDVIETYAQWRGVGTGAELLLMLVHQEMHRMPKS